MHSLVLKGTRRPLCSFLEFLCGFSIPLYMFQLLSTPKTLVCFSTEYKCYALLHIPFLGHDIESSSKQKSPGECSVHLTCSYLIFNHNSATPVVQCLKTIILHFLSSLLIAYFGWLMPEDTIQSLAYAHM